MANSEMQENTIPVCVLFRPISVRKPDGQERETGRHNEKVEKENRPKIQKLGLFL